MIVAKRLETTNLIEPETELFTFSKMAAGMYLEHYLDSKMIILWMKVCLGNNSCPLQSNAFRLVYIFSC